MPVDACDALQPSACRDKEQVLRAGECSEGPWTYEPAGAHEVVAHLDGVCDMGCASMADVAVNMGTVVRQTMPVRLQRGVLIAGIEPEVARDIARACHHGWVSTSDVAVQLKLSAEAVAGKLRSLEDAGFLEHRDSSLPGETDEWNATVSGGALTMATFLRPISRARVETLLISLLERAAAYDADDEKPYVISQILVFGSYLRPEVTELGDLDLAVSFGERHPGSATPEALLNFARLSGRRFPHIVAHLGWAETELLQVLRKGSGYINIHTEDISKITDRWQAVYPTPGQER